MDAIQTGILPVERTGTEPRRAHFWVRGAQAGLILTVMASIPGGVVAAYGFGANRNATGDFVAVLFLVAFVLLLTTPWWPVDPQFARTRAQRLESTCMIWFGLTFTTHLTWELFWLLLRDRIIASPNEPWAFMWWMYIEGGDLRYATTSPLIVTVEVLSVLNGSVGILALWLRRRPRSSLLISTLMLMATGVVHIYSALLYLFTEVFGDYPNVDTTSFVDFWIKFWVLNGVWLVMPWLVFVWGARVLRAREAPSSSAEPLIQP